MHRLLFAQKARSFYRTGCDASKLRYTGRGRRCATLQCQLRSESGPGAALPRIGAMCQKRLTASRGEDRCTIRNMDVVAVEINGDPEATINR
jgi:hypothetical protein